MATHIISRRIQYIIQFLNDGHYPSKEQIMDYLSERDLEISSRTFDRDLERIRTDFGLEIEYHKEHNGYVINQEKSAKVSSFFKLLELINVAEIFSNCLRDTKQILSYVSFDDSKSFKGIEHLKTFLIAISQKKTVQFQHENYIKNTISNYEITPLLLKEYENRWYVIGLPCGENKFKTFGLDRISNIEIGRIHIIDNAKYEKQFKIFDSIVGIDYEDGEPITVRLKVNALQVKYLKSLPLHPSQTIITTASGEHAFINYHLVPNYEFKAQILKMGPHVEVLSPESLKNEIIQLLDATINNYKF